MKEPFRGVLVVQVLLSPHAALRVLREVNRDYVTFLQHPSSVLRQLQIPSQVDFRCRRSQIIADPSRPVQEVWIFSGEPDQEEYRLHHGLLDSVDEWSELRRVCTVVLVRDDQRELPGQRAVQLHDARSGFHRDLVHAGNDTVIPFGNVAPCPLQKVVPIGSIDVCPR